MCLCVYEQKDMLGYVSIAKEWIRTRNHPVISNGPADRGSIPG